MSDSWLIATFNQCYYLLKNQWLLNSEFHNYLCVLAVGPKSVTLFTPPVTNTTHLVMWLRLKAIDDSLFEIPTELDKIFGWKPDGDTWLEDSMQP